MYPVILLCGGLGTRVQDVSLGLPKSLIEINGKPFLYHQLKLLKESGFKEVILSVGYKGNMIEEYINYNDFDLDIQFSYDGTSPLGTGGAVKKASLLSSDENFFVMYGDSYLTFDFRVAHQMYLSQMHEDFGMLMIYKDDDNLDVNNVIFDGEDILLYDKRHPTDEMKFVDYGASILNKKMFYPKPSNFDLSDLYHELSITKRLFGLQVFSRFYEVGSHSGIKQLEEKLKGEKE